LDKLDEKLNAVFAGRVVRKDLVQQVKKGTNVPTFVLEFLLAKYCASDDPDEITAGIEATFEYLNSHYVRPDESNKAQSTVQQKGDSQVPRQGACTPRREGEAPLGGDGELQLPAHRHQPEVLQGQRPVAGGRALGRG